LRKGADAETVIAALDLNQKVGKSIKFW